MTDTFRNLYTMLRRTSSLLPRLSYSSHFSRAMSSSLPAIAPSSTTSTLWLKDSTGLHSLSPKDLFNPNSEDLIAIFAVPGAFTPTCSAQHVPSFLRNLDALKSHGVSRIICVSVNDPFVMEAWRNSFANSDGIEFVADPEAKWTAEIGEEFDLRGKGLGIRSQRWAALVKGGKWVSFQRDSPGEFKVSSAEAILEELTKLK